MKRLVGYCTVYFETLMLCRLVSAVDNCFLVIKYWLYHLIALLEYINNECESVGEGKVRLG